MDTRIEITLVLKRRRTYVGNDIVKRKRLWEFLIGDVEIGKNNQPTIETKTLLYISKDVSWILMNRKRIEKDQVEVT